MNFGNLAVWSIQITALVAVASLFAALARLRAPHARLFFWQMVLFASLILPFLRPWSRETIALNTRSAAFTARLVIAQPPAHPAYTWADLLLFGIAAGIGIRLLWIAAGLIRLTWYRKTSRPLAEQTWGNEARFLISDRISGPVTFGVRKPVVLLPANFSEFDQTTRDAVLCHEIIHVRRKDWLFTLAEELIRSVFWFHPAIWWTLGEIQLAREQAVDRDAIEMLNARGAYVDALLAMAGTMMGLDAAPAFLRRRNLKKRVFSILKEGPMSKKRTYTTLAAGLCFIAVAGWIVTSALPLKGAPQIINDGAGVAVDMNGTQLLHRTAIHYPAEALSKGIEGSVTALVRTDSDGNVIDANIVSGPDEMRKAVLQSVLAWHLGKSAASSTRQITVNFAVPKSSTQAPETVAPQLAVMRKSNTGFAGAAGGTTTLKWIAIGGLASESAAELAKLLPFHAGDRFTLLDFAKMSGIVQGFDSHLTISTRQVSPTEVEVTIGPADANRNTSPAFGSGGGTPTITIEAGPQSPPLLKQVKPTYPPLAKAARVQGTVVIDVTIAKDGSVENPRIVSGPPLLQAAAVSAVGQWMYQPTNESSEARIQIAFGLTN